MKYFGFACCAACAWIYREVVLGDVYRVGSEEGEVLRGIWEDNRGLRGGRVMGKYRWMVV
jgi:hypothetical protein